MLWALYAAAEAEERHVCLQTDRSFLVTEKISRMCTVRFSDLVAVVTTCLLNQGVYTG